MSRERNSNFAKKDPSIMRDRNAAVITIPVVSRIDVPRKHGGFTSVEVDRIRKKFTLALVSGSIESIEHIADVNGDVVQVSGADGAPLYSFVKQNGWYGVVSLSPRTVIATARSLEEILAEIGDFMPRCRRRL